MKTLQRNTNVKTRGCPQRGDQGGFILVTCVLVMIVMALLAISMFRSMGVQQRIAGITRDKQVALNAALAAEAYAEWWLLQPQAATAGTVTCSTVPTVTVSSFSSPQVCGTNYPLANPATLPWGGGSSQTGNIVTPSGFSVSTSGGSNTVYYAPGFYIQLLGSSTAGTVYQVDAYGYGGSAGSAAVVQSTYVVASSGCDTSGIRRKVLGATC